MECHYFENQFLNVTRTSYRKALRLSDYHDSALKKRMDTDPDPDWAMLFNRYHPLHLELERLYTDWKTAGGTRKSQTFALKLLLRQMANNVHAWSVKVWLIHPRKTPRYKAIFPQGLKPFRTSTIISRIQAVKQLAMAIGDEAALAAVKAEAENYYTQLDEALKQKDGGKYSVKKGSILLEEARVAAMTMQYRNMGFLMSKFGDNSKFARIFFDMRALNTATQSLWRGKLKAQQSREVLVHTFIATDELRIKSTGAGGLTFFLASRPGGTDSLPITVSSMHERIITAADFGISDYHKHRYLTVVNESDSRETRFLVEVY